MIPLILRIHIVERQKKKIGLIIPLFLVWLLLLPFAIILTPLVLLAALIRWPSDYGKKIISAGPALLAVLCALSDLHVRIEGDENKVLIWMK